MKSQLSLTTMTVITHNSFPVGGHVHSSAFGSLGVNAGKETLKQCFLHSITLPNQYLPSQVDNMISK